MTKLAAIYARVSSDRQREDKTIASQTTSLREYAQVQGYTVPSGGRSARGCRQRREIPVQNGWGRVTAWAGAPAAEKVGTASGCSIRQDREGAVSGLNLGPPPAAGSRTVQPDVATSREGCVEIRLLEQVIAERFQ